MNLLLQRQLIHQQHAWTGVSQGLFEGYMDPIDSASNHFSSDRSSADITEQFRFGGKSLGVVGGTAIALANTANQVVKSGVTYVAKIGTNKVISHTVDKAKSVANERLNIQNPINLSSVTKERERNISYAESIVGRNGWELKNSFYQPIRNSSELIHGYRYSGHALDQMQNRGFVPSIIENAINNGITTVGKRPGTTVHYDPVNNLTVIKNSQNKQIITSFSGRGG